VPPGVKVPPLPLPSLPPLPLPSVSLPPLPLPSISLPIPFPLPTLPLGGLAIARGMAPLGAAEGMRGGLADILVGGLIA
jgi:phospholipid/cholesterol/gamma-HCH transport system substrate-binding protein